MNESMNALGQPIGFPLPDWRPCQAPSQTPMTGRYCRLEALSSAHADDLYAAYCQDTDGRIWTYLPYGPFNHSADYRRWVDGQTASRDPLFYAIVDPSTGQALGVASYLRIEPATGVIEVGHINYAPALQRTPAATEAMYLMMQRVFDELGYRRYEWKCDALNAGSQQAAARLGFSYEGLFRQATMYKGRNRDTAWFSIIDQEWPALKTAYQRWLAPDNFSANGQQRERLSALVESAKTAL